MRFFGMGNLGFSSLWPAHLVFPPGLELFGLSVWLQNVPFQDWPDSGSVIKKVLRNKPISNPV